MKKKLTRKFIFENIEINTTVSSYPIREVAVNQKSPRVKMSNEVSKVSNKASEKIINTL